MKKTIYQFITENLDEHGRFTASRLCDEQESGLVPPLGTEDAHYYTIDIQPNPEPARQLIADLRNYMAEPSQQNRMQIYKFLPSVGFAYYCDNFLNEFTEDEMNVVAFDLARRFFYNSDNRYPVKFALLLFGLYGMEQIKETDPELWQDIVRVAHCEEFTFAFLYACKIKNYLPQEEIWELLQVTGSWGKVFAIIDCKCRNDEERFWLLENGPDTAVEYSPLAVKLITETHLEKLLAQQLTYSQYKGAVACIGNYLLMFKQFSLKEIEANFNIQEINTQHLLELLLEQAQHFVSSADDVLEMISYATTLTSLMDEKNLPQLDINQAQLLIANFEKIIYSKDWSPEIQTNLIKDGKINYSLCDLAFELDMDIWQQLYDYWLQHPEEAELFSYLLSYDVEGRSERVLQQITTFMPYYTSSETTLLVPLRYLVDHPGQGEGIICAALKSFFELPRGFACKLLDIWGLEYITPAIRYALVEAAQLCTNDFISAHISCLLQGKHFDLEKYVREQHAKKESAS